MKRNIALLAALVVVLFSYFFLFRHFARVTAIQMDPSGYIACHYSFLPLIALITALIDQKHRGTALVFPVIYLVLTVQQAVSGSFSMYNAVGSFAGLFVITLVLWLRACTFVNDVRPK